MLEFIRDRAKGVFAWLIVGAIIVTFASVGIQQYLSGGGDNSVAKIDGAEISQGQLQTAFLQQRQRLQEMFGGELPDMFSEEMIKSQVMEQLVRQQVLVQTASSIGMQISDRSLADTITSVGAFQEDGKFSDSRYRQLLSAQGMTPGLFEQRVRRDLLANQFSSTITQTAFVTDAAIDEYLRLQQQQRSIGYLTVAKDKFKSEVSASEEEIKNYYEQHSQDYMQPERVKVDYLELKVEDLAASVEVDEAEMRQRYEARKMNYSTPEQRKASHILVKVANDPSQEEVNAAEEKAKALLDRINQGEDFAAIAKSESDDPGSAKQGGDLGFFGKGVMDPAFEKAVFSLQKGQVSEPVRSSFGFHLIKLVDIQDGKTKSFESVKAEIEKEIKTESAQEKYYELANRLGDLTFPVQYSKSLQDASMELGLPIKTSAFFSRKGGPGIAANPKVTAAAFGYEVLEGGVNSEVIELADNHVVVIRLNEHQDAKLRPLEKVRNSIVAVLETDKAKTKAKELADAVAERIRAGEKPSELAEAVGIEWSKQNTILRDTTDVNRTVSNAAFSMTHPVEGKPAIRQLELPSGDQVVLMLYSIEDGDPAKADDAARRQARVKLQQAAANADQTSVEEGIRSKMDITIKQ